MFEDGFADANSEKRCRMLRTSAKNIKTAKLLSLSRKHHKQKCLNLTKKCMKTDLLTVMKVELT